MRPAVHQASSHPQINVTSASDFRQTVSPRTATFHARNGPVAPVSDQGTRPSVVAKEGTGGNTAPTPDTESKVDNENW